MEPSRNAIERTSIYESPKFSDVQNELLNDEVDSAIDVTTNNYNFRKIHMFGEKTTGFRTTGPPQNYTKLHKYHRDNKTLFCDENFSPDDIELTEGAEGVVWKRPFEIIKDAQFIIDGADRFDINQGSLGNCWFVAAAADIIAHPSIFSFVVPEDQSLNVHYAGIFHFRFWQWGRWVDVVIDDRLPTRYDKLIYMQSSDPREFWPSLLEKAYAKFYGSYKNLDGGSITEALEDLCGGISERYLIESQADLFEIMEVSQRRSSFLGCSISNAGLGVEAERPDGLVAFHAYSVTDIREISTGARLIRIRNPWGNEKEWNGNWSDNSDCWNLIPKEERDNLRSVRHDGEFWMEFGDFQRCFTHLDLCHLDPSSFASRAPNNESSQWRVFMFDGTWVPKVTAGGSPSFDTFCHNPQYHLTIRQNDLGTVIINLILKDVRVLGKKGTQFGLAVYRVQTPAGTILGKQFFETKKWCSNHRTQNRELTIRLSLLPGKYCIIPFTEPNVYANYLLRIYGEDNANIVENDVETGYSSEAILSDNYSKRDDAFSTLFKNIVKDNREMGWYEIQQALDVVLTRALDGQKPKSSFSKDICKNIVALWDANNSGKLDRQEFEELLKDVAALNERFQHFDKDHSRKLDNFELRDLFSACGYKVNNEILQTLMVRYGDDDGMDFESFVVCAIKLRKMIDMFHGRRNDETGGEITINKRDWLKTTLYI